MKQRIICIIAGQRAGTTALQSIIKRARIAVNYGEIFQPKTEKSGGAARSFYDFSRAHDIALADILSSKEAYVVAKKYTDWLREGAGHKHVLIDMKLNSLFALSPAWQYPHEEPLFLRHLKRENAAFIFVWRESLADQILSLTISRQLGLWHNIDREKIAGRKINAPIGELQRLATLICRSEADVVGHLDDYADKIVVKFEDMFVNGVLSENFRLAFAALVEAELPDGAAGDIRPNNVDKREIVINYDAAYGAIAAVAARERSHKWHLNDL
jgi:hypothetical protein